MHTTVQTCAPPCAQICTTQAPGRRHRGRRAAGMHSCVHNATHSVQRVDCSWSGELCRCTQLCRLVHICVHKSAQLSHRVGGTGAEWQRACTAVCTPLHILCNGSTAAGRVSCEDAPNCADLCRAVRTCAHPCAQVCTTQAHGRRHRGRRASGMHSCVHTSTHSVQRVDGRWQGEL